MVSNLFYLNRCISELNDRFSGTIVHSVFTQEKNKLFFDIGDNEYSARHLIISISGNLSYLFIKDEHYKAKKNVVEFFTDLMPVTIKKFMAAKHDRIIAISTEKGIIYIFFRGAASNILFLLSDGNVLSFKKISPENKDIFLRDIENTDFSPRLINFSALFENSDFQTETVRKTYPFIHREIIRELNIRTDSNLKFKRDLLLNIIGEVQNSKICIGASEEDHKVYFIPETFSIAGKLLEKQAFTDYQSALNYYITLKFRSERIFRLRKELIKFIEKELSRTSNKLNNLKLRVEAGSKETDYRSIGDLLISNLFKLKKGMNEIDLHDFITGKVRKILLDAKMTPSQNAEKYFNKSKDEKKNYQISRTLFQTAKLNVERLRNMQESVSNSDDINELLRIKKELKIREKDKMNKNKNDDIKYRHFISDNKYHFLVGRDSKSNDLLTFKIAKQNDYWFHARGVGGSHVVLKKLESKEVMPKNIIKKAASIAAFYSKAKTSNLAPVSYTFRKFVRKKKGMEPGKVILMKEEVIIVKPEIPVDCEQIDD